MTGNNGNNESDWVIRSQASKSDIAMDMKKVQRLDGGRCEGNSKPR